MKKIEGIVSVTDAPAIIEQLRRLNIRNLATSCVNVIDKKSKHLMVYRGSVMEQESEVRVKIEVNVSDDHAERAEDLLEPSYLG
jgi:nitrogen regulatory protein PII